MYIACEKCKYNYDGECIFDSQGSGEEEDMPCYREKELIKTAVDNFLQAFVGAESNEITNEEARAHMDMLIAHKDQALNTHPYFNGATNGDMIISLFPNLKYYVRGNRVVTTIGVASSFDLDWWNAPYREWDAE